MKGVKVNIIAILRAIDLLHIHLHHNHNHNLRLLHLHLHLREEGINKKIEIKNFLNKDLLQDIAGRINIKGKLVIKLNNKK
jgi:hypothetical protein